MRERIYIYDRNDNLVNDPLRSTKYANGLRWETMWPKGYGPLSSQVKRSVTESWAVKLAHKIVVRDGQRIVYQGRLGNLTGQLDQAGEQIAVPALGWYVVLNERHVHKRWIDNAPVGRLEWPVSDDTQQSFSTDKREDFLHVRLAAYADSRAGTEVYRERYIAPAGTVVRRITFDYEIKTGEGGKVALYNVDTSSEVWSDNNTGGPNPKTGSVDHTFATPPQIFELRFSPTIADTYDPNDHVFLDNIKVRCKLDNFASPAYTAGEIVQDVLYLAGDELSGDYAAIGDPGLVLDPFVTDNDDYETADAIIQRAAAYGDASQRTWGLSVWDSARASDGKPKVVFEYRDVSDYEYAIRTTDKELTHFQDGEAEDELRNYVIVKYRDAKGITRYRTPDDNANLKDQASIDRYGRREKLLDVGQGDATRADYVGVRYLAYHKEPLRKTEIAVKGRIRTKGRQWVPVNRVRAGQRVKVVDYRGGQVYFLRHTAYDADSQVLRMSPDLPPDDLAMFFAQEKLG